MWIHGNKRDVGGGGAGAGPGISESRVHRPGEGVRPRTGRGAELRQVRWDQERKGPGAWAGSGATCRVPYRCQRCFYGAHALYCTRTDHSERSPRRGGRCLVACRRAGRQPQAAAAAGHGRTERHPTRVESTQRV
eukprot:3331210-Prymnesium_polylepis.1